jgi:hypothetical protein
VIAVQAGSGEVVVLTGRHAPRTGSVHVVAQPGDLDGLVRAAAGWRDGHDRFAALERGENVLDRLIVFVEVAAVAHSLVMLSLTRTWRDYRPSAGGHCSRSWRLRPSISQRYLGTLG